MGYVFRGFFSQVPDTAFTQQIANSVQQQGPPAAVRIISDPFFGIGCKLSDETESLFRDGKAFIGEGPPLPDWSRQFPQFVFVYIEAECWGGKCNYWGYVCRDGEILHRETAEVEGSEPLVRLLRYLGVESQGYFLPFERDFFETKADTEQS